MFEVTLETLGPRRGMKLKVTFSHQNPAKDRVVKKRAGVYGTTCSFIENGFPFEVGSSYLHPLDYKSFSREKGRKIALARTLKLARFTKEERKKVWGAYFAVQNEARGLALT